MLGYLGRRCLLALPTLFGVALIVFALMRAVPGDVVTNLVGLQGNVSAERLAELRRMFGLDLPVGVAAALNRGRWLDHLGSIFALLGLSIPGFFLGILLILLFSLKLGWFPPAGYVPFGEEPLANLRHMVLPALSLGLILAAATARIVRSTLLEVLGL